jgi:hypothetical protein
VTPYLIPFEISMVSPELFVYRGERITPRTGLEPVRYSTVTAYGQVYKEKKGSGLHSTLNGKCRRDPYIFCYIFPDVNFVSRSCTYYGVGEEKYVESYPAVEV